MAHKIREQAFYHTSIRDWPESERPREKLIRWGPQVLSDAELLALLIGSGTGGINALDLGKRLLVEYKHLSVLATKNLSEFTRFKGIGAARAARLFAAFELARRMDTDVVSKGIKIRSPEDVVKYLIPRLRGLKVEIFRILMLDSGNKVIGEKVISQGTLNASLVHPREVFKAAIDILAAGIILVHNHPSGEARPSMEDREMTGQLVQAGKVMGIPVLDHLIVTDYEHFSFLKAGLIKQ